MIWERGNIDPLHFVDSKFVIDLSVIQVSFLAHVQLGTGTSCKENFQTGFVVGGLCYFPIGRGEEIRILKTFL